MRIIYITNTRLPTEKARGVQIMKSCEAFVQAGVSVELVAPLQKNPIKGDPFSYYGVERVFNIKKVYSGDFLSRMVSKISDRTAFYLRSSVFALFSTACFLLSKHKKPDHFFYSRDYAVLFLLGLFNFNFLAEIHDLRPSRTRILLKYVFKKAKKIIVNSEGTRDEVLKFGTPHSKILVAHNGVDIEFFNIKESKEEARKKLSIPSDKKIIAYVGRLESIGLEKGVGDLIEAFKMVHSEISDMMLYIVGGPSSYIEKYNKFAEDYSNIVFTGQVDYQIIPSYLRAFDVVVIPSPAKQQFLTASPIKLFEFLAAGKTVITSDLPSLRRVLNEKNSLFFKPENVDDLAQKIKFVFENPDIADKLAKEAFNDSQKYSWVSRAKLILDFIR